MRRLFFSGAVVVLGWCGGASAEELRILDTAGLVRAVRPSTGQVRVEVEVAPRGGGALAGATLVQATGIADDRVAVVEEGRYLFDGVAPGTWQVQLRDTTERINAVRIGSPGAPVR